MSGFNYGDKGRSGLTTVYIIYNVGNLKNTYIFVQSGVGTGRQRADDIGVWTDRCKDTQTDGRGQNIHRTAEYTVQGRNG